MTPAEKTLVIALAKDGKPPRDIAHALHLEPDAIYYVLRMARRAGEDIPFFSRQLGTVTRFKPLKQHSVLVPASLMKVIERKAEAVGSTPSELVARTLEKSLITGGQDG